MIAVFNLLFLAYLLPAVGAGALALYARVKRPKWYSAMLGLLAAALAFAYATLSVRRWFHGEFIGLFQGMFEDNIMTFNPGWDQSAQPLDTFTDIRDIQKHLKSEGVALDAEADEATTGPASVMLKDPDGNIILIDQHR